jgi:haloalkane dehalogenase
MGAKEKMGYNQIVKKNRFIGMMPMLIKRKLTDFEKEMYAKPFPTESSRVPMLTLANSFPKKGKDAVAGSMGDYLNKNAVGLQASTIPKLLVYAKPGMLINKKVLSWANENLPNLTVQYVGKAKHLMEEDLPNEIGAAIKDWLADNSNFTQEKP